MLKSGCIIAARRRLARKSPKKIRKALMRALKAVAEIHSAKEVLNTARKHKLGQKNSPHWEHCFGDWLSTKNWMVELKEVGDHHKIIIFLGECWKSALHTGAWADTPARTLNVSGTWGGSYWTGILGFGCRVWGTLWLNCFCTIVMKNDFDVDNLWNHCKIAWRRVLSSRMSLSQW